MGRIYAIVPAAGKSTRMGDSVNKQLLDLSGRPVVEYALRALLAVPVDGIVLVVTPGEEAKFKKALTELIFKENIIVIQGGASRSDSVGQGLRALPNDVDFVLIHDGARPLVKPENVRESIAAAQKYGASTLAVPVKDTIKVGDSKNFTQETIPRETLWMVQTPQVFRYKLLIEAHRTAAQVGYIGTDDASLVERLGYPVKLVQGDYSNIKITTPEDLVIAKALINLEFS